MITKAKLAIYASYQGNLDSFLMEGRSNRKIIQEDDFTIIDMLVHRISLGMNKAVSKEYEEETTQLLEKHCDNNATIEEIKRFAYLA